MQTPKPISEHELARLRKLQAAHDTARANATVARDALRSYVSELTGTYRTRDIADALNVSPQWVSIIARKGQAETDRSEPQA